MVKFPGGSPGRWEKIAHELGRSVTDVSLFQLVGSYCGYVHYTDRQNQGSALVADLCV